MDREILVYVDLENKLALVGTTLDACTRTT